MWVLVVIALNVSLVFTVPGYSSEQTCSAGAKEVTTTLAAEKQHIRRTYRCIKPG